MLVGAVLGGFNSATTGQVYSLFAVAAMVLSAAAVLANSVADQGPSREGTTTDFTDDRVES